MSFGFLLAGFLATTNAGRVGLARAATAGGAGRALGAGAALVVAAVLLADALLDALDISPESFRIAAGLVLAATGLRALVAPRPAAAPLAAALVTPELAALAVSFGADEPNAKVLGAAAVALLAVAATGARRPEAALVRGAQFLAALQIVVAVALAVSGVRDV